MPSASVLPPRPISPNLEGNARRSAVPIVSIMRRETFRYVQSLFSFIPLLSFLYPFPPFYQDFIIFMFFFLISIQSNMSQSRPHPSVSAAHRLHCHSLSPEENRELFGPCNDTHGTGRAVREWRMGGGRWENGWRVTSVSTKESLSVPSNSF